MGLLEVSREKTLQHPDHRKIALDFHKKILDKIIEQDPEGAANIMGEHLKDAYMGYNLEDV